MKANPNKKRRTSARRMLPVAAAAAVPLGVWATRAAAAPSAYFDTNGTTIGYGITSGSTYSWDDPNWATASGGASATGAFPQGDFARFFGGGTAGTTAVSYTVTVGQDESMGGLFETVSASTLTINQAAGTSGDLNITSSGGAAPVGGGPATLQGFLVTGSTSNVIINAPVTGAGGIEQQSAGAISLYGNNSFTGGFESTGGQVTNYNNNNSFGTGQITLTGTSGQGYVRNGSTAVTIANNVVIPVAGTITNFASGSVNGGPGTTFTGTFTLPATGNTTFQTGQAGHITQISGVISGGGNLIVANPGTLILSGANTYTGSTTVTNTTTLKLGAANTIASSPALTLTGGTLNPGGFNQSMTATTLAVTGTNVSKIDFGSAPSEIDFANSSAVPWGGTLNLVNYDPSVDKIRFGTDATGLTSAQLSEIEAYGSNLGTATIDPNGYLVIAAPEPASALLLVAGIPLVLKRKRRRGGQSAWSGHCVVAAK